MGLALPGPSAPSSPCEVLFLAKSCIFIAFAIKLN